MGYAFGLLLGLAALWAALSGQTAPLFLIFAGVSLLLTLWLAGKLRVIDREGSPYHRVGQLLVYALWLAGQVVKANVAVIRAVFGARGAINPALVDVTTAGRSDLARAVFANSITLTPGTVTVDVAGDRLIVHALNEETSRAHAFAPMDRNASRAADGRNSSEKAKA